MGTVLVGTIGYMLVEGWNFQDSLYMTVITITTVGYMEVHTLDMAGRIFTIVLLIAGVGSALYALTALVEFFLEGRLGSTLWRRKMKNRIARIKNHFIICGYGRVGQEIARILTNEDVPLVVIDRDNEAITRAELDELLYVQADATDDRALKQAGIDSARGLIVALGSDADSTYVTLTGRQLRPDLFIESRISAPDAEAKLTRAGANRITSPYSLGARRMAMLAIQPDVADFIDTFTFHEQELSLENLVVGQESPLNGVKLGEIRQHHKAAVLTLTKKNGQLIANPDDEEVLEEGYRMIVLGTRQQLRDMEGLCKGCQLDEK